MRLYNVQYYGIKKVHKRCGGKVVSTAMGNFRCKKCNETIKDTKYIKFG